MSDRWHEDLDLYIADLQELVKDWNRAIAEMQSILRRNKFGLGALKRELAHAKELKKERER